MLRNLHTQDCDTHNSVRQSIDLVTMTVTPAVSSNQECRDWGHMCLYLGCHSHTRARVVS